MRAQEIARRLRPYIVKASESLSDTDALEAVELFDEWAVGVEYAKGKRLRYTGILYKVKQAHTSQADWTPDIATSLYEVVEEAGQGDTPDNPIPYSGNMTLYNGKYYEQYGSDNRFTFVRYEDRGHTVFADQTTEYSNRNVDTELFNSIAEFYDSHLN